MQSSDMPDEPEEHGNGKRKKRKTYIIEWRWTSLKPFSDWATYKKYATESDMKNAMAALSSSPATIEFRIKP